MATGWAAHASARPAFLPSTVPILLVRTESVWSSQPPPHKPSLKRLRMDWLESSTTRIHSAAVTVLEWRCSSMNISSQSKPSVRTSSSHALRSGEEDEDEVKKRNTLKTGQ